MEVCAALYSAWDAQACVPTALSLSLIALSLSPAFVLMHTGFYNEAPWPVGSKAKAKKYLREGAKIAPTRRNLYYAGVNAYQMGEYDDAISYFSKSLKASPCKTPSSTEADFSEFIKSEAKRGLKESEAALKKAKEGE